MLATTSAGPTLRIGATSYPVVLPRLRDPRLHLASVIVTIHVLGQVALDFRVSIVQIVISILTCAVIDVVVTFHRTRQVVWPASAMLTGSGVGLIFRIVGVEHGDWWSTEGWYWYVAVAGGSLLTKYAIRFRGTHVFNPSNVGLVVAFLLLGSSRVEPLDFWWSPLDVWMALAYAVILVGGIVITARLGLLGMAVGFWTTLALGVGVLAASGHCITARWSFTPVCGGRFWWIIMTSPEVLVFLFFMITDPRTVPEGRLRRVAFGATVAVVCTLLIAPQRDEFGAKVGLLAGLVIVCALRALFRMAIPSERADRLGALATSRIRSGPGVATAAVAGTLAVLVFGAGVVAAGGPARDAGRPLVGSAAAGSAPVASGAEIDAPVAGEGAGGFTTRELVITGAIDPRTLPGDDAGDVPPGPGPVPGAASGPGIDPTSLPAVEVDPAVRDLDAELAGAGAQGLAVTLAGILDAETAALLARDAAPLAAIEYGERLETMQGRIARGEVLVERYEPDSLYLTVGFPLGVQGGAGPALVVTGPLTQVAYGPDGQELRRKQWRCAEVTFAFVASGDGRWLLADADTAGRPDGEGPASCG